MALSTSPARTSVYLGASIEIPIVPENPTNVRAAPITSTNATTVSVVETSICRNASCVTQYSCRSPRASTRASAARPNFASTSRRASAASASRIALCTVSAAFTSGSTYSLSDGTLAYSYGTARSLRGSSGMPKSTRCFGPCAPVRLS